MGRKIAIITVLMFALTAYIIGQGFIYPSKWDQIHLGMTYRDVSNITDTEITNSSNGSGHVWNNSGILIKQEIEVFFTNEKVSSILQRQYLITGQTINIVRAESTLYNK